MRTVHLDPDPANANAVGTRITASNEPTDYIGSPTEVSARVASFVAPRTRDTSAPVPATALTSPLLAEDNTTLTEGVRGPPSGEGRRPSPAIKAPVSPLAEYALAASAESDDSSSPVLMPSRRIARRVCEYQLDDLRRDTASMYESPGKV
jgi:hypothetical protein